MMECREKIGILLKCADLKQNCEYQCSVHRLNIFSKLSQKIETCNLLEEYLTQITFTAQDEKEILHECQHTF